MWPKLVFLIDEKPAILIEKPGFSIKKPGFFDLLDIKACHNITFIHSTYAIGLYSKTQENTILQKKKKNCGGLGNKPKACQVLDSIFTNTWIAWILNIIINNLII